MNQNNEFEKNRENDHNNVYGEDSQNNYDHSYSDSAYPDEQIFYGSYENQNNNNDFNNQNTIYSSMGNLDFEENSYGKNYQSSGNPTNNRKTGYKKPKNNKVFILAVAVIFGISIGIGSQLTGIVDGISNVFSGKNTSGIVTTHTEGTENLAPKLVSQKETDLVSIVDKTSPTIVAITSKVIETDFFNNEVQQSGAGSGVICSENNDYIYIATNNHVIENSSELTVQFSTGSKANAKIVGTDPSTDLAVLRIAKSDMDKETRAVAKPITIGTSSNLKVGQDAIAIGNALGIGISVTPGVVSAVNREVSDNGTQKMIQTSAAINPGNSGGALLNSSGELIGITSIKISSTSVEGVGFAIPIDTATPIINDLINKGRVDRPYLGIYGRDVESYESQMYKVPQGVLIKSTIEGSGAEKAKIKSGDIIVDLDGHTIKGMKDISSVLSTKKIGDTVSAKVYRDGKYIKLNILLIERSV